MEDEAARSSALEHVAHCSCTGACHVRTSCTLLFWHDHILALQGAGCFDGGRLNLQPSARVSQASLETIETEHCVLGYKIDVSKARDRQQQSLVVPETG